MVVPLAVRDVMNSSVGCVAAAVQVRPPSVERNTPAPPVPANMVAPRAVREETNSSVGCVVAAVHVRPPSLERYTPLSVVPASSVVPLAVSAVQGLPPGSPDEARDHCAEVAPGP